MDYSQYTLHLHHNYSYYTLFGISTTASIDIINNIYTKLSYLLDPGYDNNQFFIKQWTDFNKISNILQHKKSKIMYDNIHLQSQYVENHNYLV